jgi:hypothetical protein
MDTSQQTPEGAAVPWRGEELGGIATQLKAAKLETGERMLRWFEFAHLPVLLQQVSAVFAYAAVWTVRNIASSAERTVALRKLLEAKDAAVRASLSD